jgi:CheY-like chemotaxis protein
VHAPREGAQPYSCNPWTVIYGEPRALWPLGSGRDFPHHTISVPPDDFALFLVQSALAGERKAVRAALVMSRKRTAQLAPAKRILIIDDHPLVRRGLTALIDAEPDLIVCAQAANQEDGLRAIAATRPDLAVVDLSLGDGGGLDLIREIRSCYGGLRVLVVTMHLAPLYARRTFAAGASGYVIKSEMTKTLLMAIRSVLRGETYGAPAI